MKPTYLINIVVSALILLSLNGCTTLSQEGKPGDTPPEFRPLIGTWARTGTGWAGIGSVEVIEITNIKPNGEADASFALNLKSSLGYRMLPHTWISIAEAHASRPTTDNQDISLFLKIGDRSYSWSHYQLVLQNGIVLSGEGFYIPYRRMIKVDFYRQAPD